MMGFRLKIYKTVWINLLVIFLAVYPFLILSELIGSDESLQDTLMIGFIGSFFTIFGFGLIFWLGFLVVVLILDFVLIRRQESNLTLKLLIEWSVISCPLVYWAFKYDTWVFLVASLALLISQVHWRRQRINQILDPDFKV
jgi:hypothetical protein